MFECLCTWWCHLMSFCLIKLQSTHCIEKNNSSESILKVGSRDYFFPKPIICCFRTTVKSHLLINQKNKILQKCKQRADYKDFVTKYLTTEKRRSKQSKKVFVFLFLFEWKVCFEIFDNWNWTKLKIMWCSQSSWKSIFSS